MMGESDTLTLRNYIKPVISYSSAVTETAVNYTSTTLHGASVGLNVICFMSDSGFGDTYLGSESVSL